MEHNKMNTNSSPENQAPVQGRRQELSERIDKVLGKITKAEKLNVAVSLGLITIALWISLVKFIDWHLGSKLIILSVAALVFMFKSVIDLNSVGRIKKAASRKEQLEEASRYRKRERFSKMILAAFISFYIIVDVVFVGSTGLIVFGAACIILGAVLIFNTGDDSFYNKRAVSLEEDLRELVELEK